MQKTKQQIYVGTESLPVVSYEGELLVVDLELAQFRSVRGRCEAISFGTVFGKELCAQSGIRICKHCGTSLMLAKTVAENPLHCPSCLSRL